MKLEQNKQIDFASNAGFEGLDAKIDQDSMHKLWDMLQNPYKNPIGAIIREYVSNSFDAHAEAKFIKEHTIEEIRAEYKIYQEIEDSEIITLKKYLEVFNDDAVTVSLEKDDTGWYWSTEDFGVGLSPNRVRDVFVSYLKSTKETSNSMIGAFGLGSKSGLAYADIVFIRSRYNGFESSYMLRKGETGPRLDIIYELMETTERNGTEIKIYLKDYSSDAYDFRKEMGTQLAYFDNVYFSNNSYVNNDFKIVRGKTWIKSTSSTPHVGTHLCLGKVAYPIDWKILGIENPYIPVALLFNIGELDVIQTREDVKYTPRTKEAILLKLDEFYEEMRERWAELPKECASLKEYYLKLREKPELKFLEDSVKLDISDIDGIVNDFYFRPFKNIPLTLPKEYRDCFFEYKWSGWFKTKFNPIEGSVGYMIDGAVPHVVRNSSFKLYRISGDHDPKKSKYILYKDNVDSLIFIRQKSRKNSKLLKVLLKEYVKELGLKDVPRDRWREAITVFQKEIQKIVLEKTTSYDRTVIDSEWLKAQRKVSNRDFSKMKVSSFSFPGFGQLPYGPSDIKLSPAELEKNGRALYFVGTQEERPLVDAIRKLYILFTGLPDTKHFKYYQHHEVAPTNVKKYFNTKNFMTVDKFKQGDSTVFKKTMSLYKIYSSQPNKFKKLQSLFQPTLGELFKMVSPKLFIKWNQYKDIMTKATDIILKSSTSGFIQNECYPVAVAFDLFDKKFEEDILGLIDTMGSFPEHIEKIYSNITAGHRYYLHPPLAELIKEQMYFHNKYGKGPKVLLDVHYVINMNAKYNQSPKAFPKNSITTKELIMAELP